MLLKLLELLVSTQTPSAGLIESTGCILLCLFLLHGRCGIFFGSTSAVEDEHSRAMLGKQSGRSYRQSMLTHLEKIGASSISGIGAFDKLPVISSKLTLHVTGADEAEKDWRLFDIWNRRLVSEQPIF
ncbi:unnamed protein product [Malus fusca]